MSVVPVTELYPKCKCTILNLKT